MHVLHDGAHYAADTEQGISVDKIPSTASGFGSWRSFLSGKSNGSAVAPEAVGSAVPKKPPDPQGTEPVPKTPRTVLKTTRPAFFIFSLLFQLALIVIAVLFAALKGPKTEEFKIAIGVAMVGDFVENGRLQGDGRPCGL